jgi:hypothetical protein
MQAAAEDKSSKSAKDGNIDRLEQRLKTYILNPLVKMEIEVLQKPKVAFQFEMEPK